MSYELVGLAVTIWFIGRSFAPIWLMESNSKKDRKSGKSDKKRLSESGGVTRPPVKLYIAGEAIGGSHGSTDVNEKIAAIISFSIPDFGVMFRCRVSAQPYRLTALAAVTALRFVEKSLPKVSREKFLLMTDSPGFYFAVTPQELDGVESTSRPDILGEYRSKYDLTPKLIERSENSARFNCEALPQSPTDVTPTLILDQNIWKSSGKMLPLQKGIDL